MAVRKRYEESLSVDGPPAEWLDRVAQAVDGKPFRLERRQDELRSVTAAYRSATCRGDLTVNLHPQGAGTRMELSVVAAADNIYAVFSSPGRRILQDFRSRL